MALVITVAAAAALVAVVSVALTYGRRVMRERDCDRWNSLVPLQGEVVSMVIGDHRGLWRTRTGRLFLDTSNGNPTQGGWLLTSGGKPIRFLVVQVREVRRPETGSLLGGPW